MALVVFVLLSAVALGGVLAMIASRDAAHGALFLVVSFASLGGLFGLLDAPFVAAIQVLVYAGAILVLFLFVIMTVDLRAGVPREGRLRTIVPAVLLAAVLGVLLTVALTGAARAPGAPSGPAGGAEGLGRLLLREYLYPFEITSLLIVGALAGALTLVRREDAR